jgi:hypothetical protein
MRHASVNCCCHSARGSTRTVNPVVAVLAEQHFLAVLREHVAVDASQDRALFAILEVVHRETRAIALTDEVQDGAVGRGKRPMIGRPAGNGADALFEPVDVDRDVDG